MRGQHRGDRIDETIDEDEPIDLGRSDIAIGSTLCAESDDHVGNESCRVACAQNLRDYAEDALQLHQRLRDVEERGSVSLEVALAEGRVELQAHDVRVEGNKVEVELPHVHVAEDSLLFKESLQDHILPRHKDDLVGVVDRALDIRPNVRRDALGVRERRAEDVNHRFGAKLCRRGLRIDEGQIINH
eukprot:Amastigsp_a843168_5.p2 type:complete len:187 gc:universal Amastigsp_a843168_5:762-202(-)